MDIFECHLHTHYSVLDGQATPQEYMERAVELGMSSLSVTDHGTLSSHREFQRAAKEAGIKPVLGIEAYYSTTDRFDRRSNTTRQDGTSVYNHIVILAKNQNGLKNLQRLDEIAWSEGFYSKPRMDFETLEEYHDDLIVLSGCLNGPIAKSLEFGDDFLARRQAEAFKSVFGDDFYIEVQGHNPIGINTGLLKIADEQKIKPVVTSDCHYARENDLWITEAMLILSTKPKMGKPFDLAEAKTMDWLDRYNYMYPDRKMTFQDLNLFLRSRQDHKDLFMAQHIERDDIYKNTLEVESKIGEYEYYENLDLLPKPVGNPDDLLRKKVTAGIKSRALDQSYTDQAEYELKVISDKGFAPYFINVGKMVAWAKKQDIFMGPGRGSAASSVVVYALGITEIDPLKNNLQFFRFLDPDRPDYPDIDIDFEDKRRDEVKGYLARQHKHTASIATFGYFKDNGAVRAAARVLRIPVGDVNKALKRVSTWDEFLTSGYTKEFRKLHPEVVKLAGALRGRINTVGMHAGGVVLGSEPLSRFVPIETAVDKEDKEGPRKPVVAYGKEEVADIGLIKLDLLSLKMLTVIKDCLALIDSKQGVKIELNDLNMEDSDVYDMLSAGYTKGIFQCGEGAYTSVILKMGGVHNFEELAASNALVRPGASDSSFGANYIKGKEGDFEYIHPDVEYFTKDTYGQIIYDEQTMLLCIELAGMSVVDTNRVRKAIHDKKPDQLAKWKNAFITGATEKIGIRRARALWKDLEASGNYSFNRAHAVSYSTISYWCAYLKYYYPLEYMTALLNNEKSKDNVLEYLIETRRLGIDVLLPNINKSDISFSIEDESIRFGLSNIKGLSDKLASRVIEYRPYESYAEFSAKVLEKYSGLNIRVLHAFNAIGAATFPDNPKHGQERDNFYEYLNIPAFESVDLTPEIKAQLRPLDEYSDSDTFVSMGMVRKVKRGKGWALVEFVDETASAGAFTDDNTPIEEGQMYVFLISKNRIARYVSTTDLVEGRAKRFMEFLQADELDIGNALQVVSFKTRDTKAGKKMGHLVVADKNKEMVGAMVFPSTWAKAYTMCDEGVVLNVGFDKTKDGSLFVSRLERIHNG
jgi:DNA polymerase III subunit alpha